MTPRTNLYCRVATTFSEDGAIDEEAFRTFLQRFVDARIGVYLASLGSGESGAMTFEELRRVYRIGVETCRGLIPVCANPPEKLTVRETLEHVRLAIDAGTEIVNLYGPAAWHGFQPTAEEFFAFFDELLPHVNHPVAFSPNPSIGRAPTPAMLAELCSKHSQIVAINLVNQTEEYFIELKGRLDHPVALNVPLAGSMSALLLGASAVIGAELNMLPKTYRLYVNLIGEGRFAQAASVYADLVRFSQYVAGWRSAHPRWIKMMMKVLGIPGWTIRGPYLMPGADEQRAFLDGLLRLGLAEIDELGRAGGIGLQR